MTMPTSDQVLGKFEVTWEFMLSVCRLATALPVADARALVREIERTDALMPILDPTGYRKIIHNTTHWREVAGAFLTFRTVLDRVLVEERDRRPPPVVQP